MPTTNIHGRSLILPGSEESQLSQAYSLQRITENLYNTARRTQSKTARVKKVLVCTPAVTSATGGKQRNPTEKIFDAHSYHVLRQRLEHLLINDKRYCGGGRGSHGMRQATLKKTSGTLLSADFCGAVERSAIARRAGPHLFGGAPLLQP